MTIISHPALTPDSYSYLAAAANLLKGVGFGIGYQSWPPLYPVVLAAFERIGLNGQWGVLNLMLLVFLNLSVLALLRQLSVPLAAAIVLCLAIECSSPMRFVYGALWSEPLFIPLVVGWLHFWSRYLVYDNKTDLVLACVFNAACLLTRHAAIPLMGTMIVTWLARSPRPSLKAWLAPLAALGLSLAPYLLWCYRTWLLSGAIAGARDPQPQPSWMVFWGFSATLSHWLLPGWYWDGATPIAITSALVVVIGCVAVAVVLLVRRNAISGATPIQHQIALTSALFAVTYMVFLLWACLITKLDIPHDRYLAPVFVPVVVTFGFGLRQLHLKLLPATRYAVTGLAAIWVLSDILLP